MGLLKCYQCDKEIYFDENWKSKNHKYIPLQKDTKKPHQCPKAGTTSGLSKYGKLKLNFRKFKSRYKTYKGSSSKYTAPETKYREWSSLAQTLKAVDQRDLSRVRKIVPQSLYDADFVIVDEDLEIDKEKNS